MDVYGTNCVKFEGASAEDSQRWLARELHVVQPKIVVVMGQDARTCLNAVGFPLSDEVEDKPGEIQRFTPTIDALVTPGVDESLDEDKTKRAFWEAFKALGPWWSELPPY
jgi:uracil-DNA glycosylase